MLRIASLALCTMTTFALAADPAATVGGGTVDQPAVGPAPAFDVGGGGFTLVKNWDFGKNGTIKSIEDLTAEFQYHDQFGTVANGTKYGAVIVAPTQDVALKWTHTGPQPVEDPKNPVREIFDDSMKTYLVPLKGATTVKAADHVVGCGSFQAKFKLPRGGKLLGQDVIWETRVRYEPPKYFWFALWVSGNKWNQGAEIDLVESFGYDNGGKYTNYDGRIWHSSVVGGTSVTNYHKNWEAGMKKHGVLTADKPTYNAAEWHTWTLLYRKDDTFSCYVDGIEVQSGSTPWTLKTEENGEALDMSFIFDGGWSHREVKNVNFPLPASELKGKFYDWDYSRIYLRGTPTASAEN